jgi:hypothetical protein
MDINAMAMIIAGCLLVGGIIGWRLCGREFDRPYSLEPSVQGRLFMEVHAERRGEF